MERQASTASAASHAGMEDSEIESILTEPYDYITQVPGKDVRGKLIYAFNKWLKVGATP